MKGLITTKRLYLRELKEEDLKSLSKVLIDPRSSKYYPYDFDETRVEAWIKKNQRRYESLGFGLWAVCLKETGELIGDCGLTLQLIDGELLPEIGYHIRPDYWKQGYAKEAAQGVRDWAFTHTPFRELYSYMLKSNTPSQKTAESYGASLFHEYLNDDGVEVTVYRLLKKRVI